jgi:hypothetical protein
MDVMATLVRHSGRIRILGARRRLGRPENCVRRVIVVRLPLAMRWYESAVRSVSGHLSPSSETGAKIDRLEGAPTWLTLGLLVAVALALYFRQLFMGETFFLRDHLVYTWTERKILADALRLGQVPEWNSLVGFGTQFAASSANGVTYPPLWLVGLLRLPFAMDLAVAAHVLLGGVGTALLSRRLGTSALGGAFAGCAWMCSGYVTSIAPNKIFLGTAWIPWIAWAADRIAGAAPDRRALFHAGLGAAAVIGAQLLAGDPASSVTAALTAVAVVLARARARIAALIAMAASTATALLLAAAGVLPALALLPHTSRAALGEDEGVIWSLHPLRLLEIVWPRPFGDAVDPATNLAQLVANAGAGRLETGWSYSLFVGAPLIALAALAAIRGARGARGLWISAGALIVIALGAYTPVYAAFRAAFPPEQILRYPEKHFAGALVLLCAMAGVGLHELHRRSDAWAASWSLSAGVAAMALPLGALALFRERVADALRARAFLVPELDVDAALRASLRSGVPALAIAVLASLALLASARRDSRHRWVGWIAVALLIGHAGKEAWAITPLAPVRDLVRRPLLLQRVVPTEGLPADRPPPRVLRSPLMDAALPRRLQAAYRQETLLLNAPGRWGVGAVPGFEGWRSRELEELWRAAGRMPVHAFLTLFGIDWVVVPRELAPMLAPPDRGAGEPVLAQLTLDIAAMGRPSEAFGWTIVKTEGVRPRAFVAPRWRWTPASTAVTALLDRATNLDPGLVILTGEGEASPEGGRDALPPEPCAIASYRPERIALSCTSSVGGYALLLEENAPGWRATVNGAPAPIVSADVLLRAVAIPPGTHEVVFSYRTPLLVEGVVLSAGAWLALIALAWARRTSLSKWK